MATSSSKAAFDGRMMRRALGLARRGLGRTHPNPPVGAVIVKRGNVLGQGWHHRAGEPHAEILALEKAGRKARGATVYCTLEPCPMKGRTPACTAALIAAGVARVVIGSRDPDSRVAGRGVGRLRAAGITVDVSTEAPACDDLLRFYRRHRTSGRPWVRLKLATSMDGRIALRDGKSRWITGVEARRMVHRWRDEFDAVLVGAGTVRKDDPTLDCRRRGGRDPIRIVADSRLRVPGTARIFRQGRGPVWVITTRNSAPARRAAREAAGALVLPVRSHGGRVEPGAMLETLGSRGVTSVLVEGGGELAASLLRRRLVDEIACFQAPLLIGGDGIPMIGGLEIGSLASALELSDLRTTRVGSDRLWIARLEVEA